MCRVGVHLGGCGIGISEHVACKFHHGHLHTQANSEEGDSVLPGIAHCGDFSGDTPLSEAGSYQNAVHSLEDLVYVSLVDVLRMDAVNIYLALIGRSGVYKGFLNRFVSVLQLDVLSYEGDIGLSLRIPKAGEERFQGRKVGYGRAVGDFHLVHDEGVQALIFHIEGDLVDTPGVGRFDDVSGAHVAQKRDLLSQ